MEFESLRTTLFHIFHRMENPGRNEPCHCGSGKKYKKCCLQKDIETHGRKALDFSYESHLAMRRAVTDKLDRIITQHATKEEIQAYADFYWDTPLLDDGELERLRKDEVSFTALSNQMLASLSDAFVLKGQSPARFALRQTPDRFSQAEREFLQAYEDARMTYFQAREFFPETGRLVVEDLFDGKRFTIFDKSASTTGRLYDILCGRLAPIPSKDGFAFESLGGSIIPPREKDRLLEALEFLRADERLDPVPEQPLHGFLEANPIVFYWVDLWIWHATRFPPMPRLATSDGEELVSIQARFSTPDSGLLASALERQRNFRMDEEKGGRIFTWLNAKGMAMGTLRIRKGSNELHLDTNSRERFKKWEKKLKSLGEITFLGKKEESSASMLSKAMRKGPSGNAEEGKSRKIPPQGGLKDADFSAIFPQVKEMMISRWISEPVPALGGLTPIKASKSPSGRKRLNELLEEFENSNARLPADRQTMVVMDVDELRKRLGMEEDS